MINWEEKGKQYYAMGLRFLTPDFKIKRDNKESVVELKVCAVYQGKDTHRNDGKESVVLVANPISADFDDELRDLAANCEMDANYVFDRMEHDLWTEEFGIMLAKKMINEILIPKGFMIGKVNDNEWTDTLTEDYTFDRFTRINYKTEFFGE